MNENQARIIASKIEDVLTEYGVWYTRKERVKGGLDSICFEDVSVKVTEKPKQVRRSL